jgi:hypothetical protein
MRNGSKTGNGIPAIIPDSASDSKGRKSGLSINTDTASESTNEDDEEFKEPNSPVDNINAEDWAAMEAEIAEFMSSDDEDMSEMDEEDEYESDNSQSSNGKVARKRKAAELSAGTEDEDWGESDLQKRKKRAFERTSSLTKVQNAADAHGAKKPAKEDNDEDDLEREMMLAMQAAEEEEEATSKANEKAPSTATGAIKGTGDGGG